MIVVIRNLIQNSFKYADTERGVDVILDNNQGNILIKIRDYGPGISQKESKKIFEPFYRSHGTKKISGIGLGLSIAKKIIKSHRGNIKLNLDVSSGTEFNLYLPKGGQHD